MSGAPSPSQPPLGPDPYARALRGLRGPVLAAAGFSVLLNLLMLTGPLYMLQIYDRVLGSGSVATLKGLFLIVVVLYAFMGFFELVRARLLARAGQRLDAGLGAAAMRAWLHAPRTGEAEAPLRDLETLRSFLSGPTMGGIFDAPWIPLYLGILFLIHPWLGWLTLAGAGVVALAAWASRRLTRPHLEGAALIEAEARLLADQGRRNGEMVQAMGMEGRIAARWRHIHDAALARGQRASDLSEVTAAFSRSFRLLLQSAMLTLGAWLVLGHEMTAGMIVASSILSGRALAPVDQIIAQWQAIGRASLAHRGLRRFFAARHAEPVRVDLPLPTGRLAVAGLTRLGPKREGERAKLLSQIGFELAPGDGLGVIGNSAAGKSTLARLLVGAWEPDAGEIRFDGATRAQWDPEVLGRAIGYLPQQVELLPGTIRDNITRFDPAARDEDMFEAARLTGMHEAILALPEGYATRVGVPGQPLSGGQIQRIGLVRALFGAPRIVVLDEPNSNLDAQGEAALSAAVRLLRERGTTVILMTHRTSALAEVNKLMLLANGVAVRFGDRDEVLRGLMRRPVPSAQGPVTASVAGSVTGPVAAPRAGSAAGMAPVPEAEDEPEEAAAGPGTAGCAERRPAEAVPAPPAAADFPGAAAREARAPLILGEPLAPGPRHLRQGEAG